LSVEEWFYFLVPLFLFLACKCSPDSEKKRVFCVAIWLVLVGSITIRFARTQSSAFADPAAWELLFRKQVITRMDAIMLGCLGAWVHFSHPVFGLRRARPAWAIAGLLIWLGGMTYYRLYPQNHFYNDYLTLLVVPVGTLLMLPMMSQMRGGTS